jgi:hypothetical protein
LEEVVEGDGDRGRAGLCDQLGEWSPAGPRDGYLAAAGDGVQGGSEQFACPMADDDAGGFDSVGAGDRRPQGGRGRVRVGVDRAAERERGGVDDLRVRWAVPRGSGQVERRLLGGVAAELLVAALAQLARDLVRGELVELAVVAQEAPKWGGGPAQWAIPC